MNRVKRLASQKRYRDAHREERRAKDAAYKRAARKANPELARAKDREWYWRNIDRKRAQAAKRNAKRRALFAVDADAYAKKRARDRMSALRLKRKSKWKPYSPRFACRIPDWATKGQRIMDTASPWLPENMTPEQNAYARELAIERRERRERMCK